MDEPVENGVGDGRIADDLVPAIDRHLAGDDRRPALVAVLDDLEEVAPLIVGERFGSPIVEDEQVDPFKRLQQPRISTVTAGEAKGREEPRRPVVGDGEVFAASLLAEGAGAFVAGSHRHRITGIGSPQA